jgi:hypothetical protein
MHPLLLEPSIETGKGINATVIASVELRTKPNSFVSFLEALNFEDGKRLRSWARDLLPAPLRRELEVIEKS